MFIFSFVTLSLIAKKYASIKTADLNIQCVRKGLHSFDLE